MSPLENLKKSARRWLKALRPDDADAHVRLTEQIRMHPPVLLYATFSTQYALARDHES
jgi:hypothetical protein